ncbi:MAG: type II toxin-antitoxin system RelE/ParE family toxin [Nitratireductor sp.]|nr:type II toxin-antitoxin system RelE/ParE family toxin [Nitratireductor sp.]MCB1460592.1 type II toxin-antitoxin system RelE/ParE family toxin [Nitratireductor sp.]
MKVLPVHLRESAVADLDGIAFDIALASSSPDVGLGFMQRIRNRCLKIGNVPMGGVSREDLGAGIRMVPFEHSAVILYRVTERRVEIVNVFFGGRDYEAILRSQKPV